MSRSCCPGGLLPFHSCLTASQGPSFVAFVSEPHCRSRDTGWQWEAGKGAHQQMAMEENDDFVTKPNFEYHLSLSLAV